jgi:DNA-directed RNA polymerase specialized sigma24 family protein
MALMSSSSECMKLRIDSAADQAILTALREKDQRQAAQLLNRYYSNAVFNLCSAQVDAREQAEDLTHEAFSCAFTSLPSFHGETSARSWLITIARKCCLEHLARLEVSDETQQDLLTTVQLDSGISERLKISESLHRRLEVLASSL